jgi:hypothetical protein
MLSPRMPLSSRDLTWRKTASGHALYLFNRGKPLATVEPDTQHAGMWRIHMPDGWISDIANLSRAKDGAILSALSVLNHRQTARNLPPVAQNGRERSL